MYACSVERDCFFNSLITLKNKRGSNEGGLIYPSEDVLYICFKTEKTLKQYDFSNKVINKLKIQSEVLTYFIFNSNIFRSLQSHSCETRSPLTDHVTLLIKSLTSKYINLKNNYSFNMLSEKKPSLRTWYSSVLIQCYLKNSNKNFSVTQIKKWIRKWIMEKIMKDLKIKAPNNSVDPNDSDCDYGECIECLWPCESYSSNKC